MFFKILLFDIDGTLLLSGQAGYRALTRTFKELFGVARGFDDIPVAGMTDESILTAALERAGVAADLETRARFHTRYCELLADEIHFPGPRKGLMRGVAALLETLSRCNDIRCGLVTGNFARPAQIKLEHFELWRFFHFGAYGDDAAVRDELVPIAVERARRDGVAVERAGDVVVIGDEVYGAQEGSSLAPMAANVAERLTRYRTELANQVSELVLARRRLIGARSVVQSLSLREQVSHELDVQESASRPLPASAQVPIEHS